ncbi:MAG: portal protein [Fusobacteriaceae bacterium]
MREEMFPADDKKKEPSLNELNTMLKEAERQKDIVLPRIEKIMEYTQVTSKSNVDTTDPEWNKIDLALHECVEGFKNFLMNGIFGLRNEFAKLDTMTALVKKKFGGKISQESSIKKELQEITTDTFEFILDSNYYSEIAISMRDFGNLGTGSYKIYETDDKKFPFTFEHVPISSLFFLEDFSGRPSFVFQKFKDVACQNLKKKYPNIIIPSYEKYLAEKKDDQVDDEKITYIEYSYQMYDGHETDYHWGICSEGFGERYCNKILKYNPYKVFRFRKISGTCWGEGLGMAALQNFEKIAFYKNETSRAIKKTIDPTMNYLGDKNYLKNLSMEPGDINYIGDGNKENEAMFQSTSINFNLAPTMDLIRTLVQEVREVYLYMPFGTMDEKAGMAPMSVYEAQKRYAAIKDKYSDTVELIHVEILRPTFEAPLEILKKNGTIVIKPEYQDFIRIKYQNQITSALQKQEVNDVMSFQQIINGLFPESARHALKMEKVVPMVAENLEVNKDLVSTSDEIKALVEQDRAQAMALAAAQAAKASGKQVEGADTMVEQNIKQGG